MTDRVGLFLLDSIDEPHRSIAGDYDVLFTELFAPLLGEGVEFRLYDARTGELPDHAECDGWVIPGSRQSVYEDDAWIGELRTWTTEALERRTPLAGICFGHQLIAQAMGAPVGRSDGGWNIGVIDYEVHAKPAHVVEVPERYRLIASHQDQVFELPAGAELFASSPRCPVAGFSVDDHVLCVQGHPEFEAPLAASLYRSRVERIGRQPVDEALATLDRSPDRHLVARWLLATIDGAATGPAR